MEIANISRTYQLQIAEDNRLNELTIAELSRREDRDLANDQQHQNILIEYQTFLARLITDYGVNLSMKPEAKLAANFMTRTALSQLDTKRRGILLRSLHDAKLITIAKRNDLSSIVDLQQADLSNIVFGILPKVTHKLPRFRYIVWDRLWLPHAILTNTSFRHTALQCPTFSNANMDSADLSFAIQGNYICFGSVYQSQANFEGTSLVNASLYETDFRFTSFNGANLAFANMHGLNCHECNFSLANLIQADLSFSTIIHYFVLHHGRSDFSKANLSHAVLHKARYRAISFDQTDWSNVQASQIQIYNCTFANAIMNNGSFKKSIIQISEFRDTSLYSIDLSDAALSNIIFSNSDMRNTNLSNLKCDYCNFINVTLHGAILKNASLRYSNFLNCRLDVGQLEQAIDLFGSTLPNGTVIENSNLK
jgi:uncharacterized protein YjbI with pentapeptide repeats